MGSCGLGLRPSWPAGYTRVGYASKERVMGWDVERLWPDPAFDFENYRRMLGGPSGDAFDIVNLQENFKKLKRYLNVYHAQRSTTSGVLVAVLEAPAERLVETTWSQSPSAGLLFHTLAVCLVMAAAGAVIPELRLAGCAPLPPPDSELRACLARQGLTVRETGCLDRQYAVMTFFPYAGGCAVCHLRETCPKRRTPGEGAFPNDPR